MPDPQTTNFAGDEPIKIQITPDTKQLMADNVLMALALRGITPDRNTQTEAEVAETEEAIRAACSRALPLMGS